MSAFYAAFLAKTGNGFVLCALRTNVYRFMRSTTIIYEGEVESLKCVDEFVTSATTNQEVGVALAGKDVRFEANDAVQVFEKITVRPQIDWHPLGF